MIWKCYFEIGSIYYLGLWTCAVSSLVGVCQSLTDVCWWALNLHHPWQPEHQRFESVNDTPVWCCWAPSGGMGMRECGAAQTWISFLIPTDNSQQSQTTGILTRDSHRISPLIFSIVVGMASCFMHHWALMGFSYSGLVWSGVLHKQHKHQWVTSSPETRHPAKDWALGHCIAAGRDALGCGTGLSGPLMAAVFLKATKATAVFLKATDNTYNISIGHYNIILGLHYI